MKAKMNAFFIALAIASLSLLAAGCAQPASVAQDRHALLIAITNYPQQALDYPVADAVLLKNLLESKGWTVWPVGAENILEDSAATKSAIESTIKSFLGSLDSGATALIYFSGHGTVSNTEAVNYESFHNTLNGFTGDIGDTLLVPYDFDFDTWAGGIAPSEMSSWISDSSPTKNVIFISDSCYSGGFVPSGDSADSIASPFDSLSGNAVSVSSLAALGDFGALLAKNAAETGALVPIAISAAGNEESSYEVASLGGGHGVFTWYLSQAATHGDSNGDGYVTCTEAYTYAANSINRYWNNVYSRSEAFYPHISGGLRDLVLFDNN